MDPSDPLLAHAPVGIARADLTGRITGANPALAKILGYPVEELTRRTLLDLAHPDDHDLHRRLLNDLLHDGSAYLTETRWLHRDGGTIWCDARASVAPGVPGQESFLVATFLDITKRRGEELDLRSQHDSYEQMFQTASSAIVILDGGGTVRRVYPGFTRLFGYSKEEAIGERIHSLIAPDDRREEIDLNLREALAGRTISIETVRQHKNGASIHVSVLGRSFRLQGGEAGVFLLYRDITQRKEAEALTQRLSTTDELTGLWNRRGFFTLASQEIKRAQRQGVGLIVVYADLDCMKGINDRYGHVEGDWVLTEVAHILRDSCRGSDTVARMGGDEFVILAAGTRSGEQVVPERIRNAIDGFNRRSDREYVVSLSMGTVYFEPGEAFDFDAMLALADRRMYEAKAVRTKTRGENAEAADASGRAGN